MYELTETIGVLKYTAEALGAVLTIPLLIYGSIFLRLLSQKKKLEIDSLKKQKSGNDS